LRKYATRPAHVITSLTVEFATYFASVNPRFDAHRFMEASFDPDSLKDESVGEDLPARQIAMRCARMVMDKESFEAALDRFQNEYLPNTIAEKIKQEQGE